jgi:hypothetical protein
MVGTDPGTGLLKASNRAASRRHGTPCPLFDRKNAMHVIGHDDKSLDFDAGKMIGNVDPTGANYVADRAEPHAAVLYPAEDAALAKRTNRNEIHSGLRIVEVPEAYRPANGTIEIIGHG